MRRLLSNRRGLQAGAAALTEYGADQVLYVADVHPHRFVVRSNRGTVATGAFGYRVVGKRRDLATGRMEKVMVPKPIDVTSVKQVVPPSIPTAPSPERPDR